MSDFLLQWCYMVTYIRMILIVNLFMSFVGTKNSIALLMASTGISNAIPFWQCNQAWKMC